MWFITTVHSKPNFYKSKTNIVKHEDVKINWITEHTYIEGNQHLKSGSSTPFIVDVQQAIAALSDAGITGFPNKIKAKEFTKKLEHGSFKYLRVIDKTFKSEHRRLTRELKR